MAPQVANNVTFIQMIIQAYTTRYAIPRYRRGMLLQFGQ